MSRSLSSLGWKLYAIGVTQLVLLFVVFVGVGVLLNRTPNLGAVTIYDHRGSVVATTIDPPLSPDNAFPPAFPIMVSGQPGRMVISPMDHSPFGLGPIPTLLLGGLIIVGIGSLLTGRWIVRPLRELARAAHALGSGDLRARSGLERTDELGDLARAFDEMGDRIEHLLLAEKELLANVSHELRTPLARIRVALDIAGEGDLQAGTMSLSEIDLDLSELETLIDDILTTTQLAIAHGPSGATQFALRARALPVSALCARAAERFRAGYPMRELELVVEPGLPDVSADPVLLRRVFDNLLSNAHKYSPDAASVLTLQAFGCDGQVVLEVIDRGMGIEVHDLPHLFTPFFRSDRSRTRGTGGVGLGLTLAKRIVEAHGGTIAVFSLVGDGTTVRVVLPSFNSTSDGYPTTMTGPAL